MNRPKNIGTKAETAVKNYLLSAGYTELEAHRNVLKGSQDEGDVWLRDPQRGLIVFEVKGGKAAKEASYEQIKKWYAEAEKEKQNAGANYGFLVTQRAGVGYPNAGNWWAYAALGDLFSLGTDNSYPSDLLVRVCLIDLIGLVRG